MPKFKLILALGAMLALSACGSPQQTSAPAAPKALDTAAPVSVAPTTIVETAKIAPTAAETAKAEIGESTAAKVVKAAPAGSTKALAKPIFIDFFAEW